MVYLLVGLGGAFGSVLRYMLGVALLQLNPEAFPYGTLAANLAGSFLLGLLTVAWQKNDKFPVEITAALGTGLIGSFTTFSAFSIETVVLIQDGRYFLMLLYILLSSLGGLIFAWFGMKMSRREGEVQ